MIEVDARGLSCPEPVMLTRKATLDKPKDIQVKVDNKVAMENVRKFLQKEGYTVGVKEEKEERVLHGKK